MSAYLAARLVAVKDRHSVAVPSKHRSDCCAEGAAAQHADALRSMVGDGRGY